MTIKSLLRCVKAIVLFVATAFCGGAWAATPLALFTGEDLADGKVINGLTLSLNGNSVADGVITIGDKPVLIDGVTGSEASVVVKYTGAITASEFAIATAKATAKEDAVGVWCDATKLHGIWQDGAWSSGTVVNDETLPSAESVNHSFCFSYSSGSGTSLMIDCAEKYVAGSLKSSSYSPVGFAIGGARKDSPVKPAATGMKIESILVLSGIMTANEYASYMSSGSATSVTISEPQTKTALSDYGFLVTEFDYTSAANKISLTNVPDLHNKTIRIQNAAELAPGAYTLIEWSDYIPTNSSGYGMPALELPGATRADVRLIPLVNKLVLQVLEPDQETKRPLRIWCVGDSITEGYNNDSGRNFGDCANYRVQLAMKLSLEGYRPRMVGQFQHRSYLPSGEWAPDEWAWHSGVSAQRVWTSKSLGGGFNNRAGYMESIDAAMFQVGEADVVLIKLSTNDIGNGDSAEHIVDGLQKIVAKVAAGMPNAKIIVATPVWYGGRPAITTVSELIREWVATNPCDGRVSLADLNATLPTNVDEQGRALFCSDATHPTWHGHDRMSDTWLSAIKKVYAKTDAPEKSEIAAIKTGAENNIPEAYRQDFKKNRTLAIPVNASYTFADDSRVPGYVVVNEAANSVSKVGYYLELVRPSTDMRNEEIRYVWVDMDVPGGKTLSDLLVPTKATLQCAVNKLHVYSNMGSIHNVAADDDSITGFLEFSPFDATSGTTSIAGAPTKLWDCMDWNDTLPTEGANGGRGVMQIHRVKKNDDELWNGGETLFAWNNWGEANDLSTKDNPQNGAVGEIGIGNYAQHWMTSTETNGSGNPLRYGYGAQVNAALNAGIGLGGNFLSSDYTTSRFSPWFDTMNAKAYTVRNLEIWVKEGEVVDPVAKIGEEPYATLADALATVESDATTITLVKACDETVSIPAKATVIATAEAAFTGSVFGSGRLVCEGYAPATNGALATSLRNAAWTGTLELKNVTQANYQYDLQLLANVGSTVCFNGYTNYPCAPTNSGKVGRDVVAGAWEIGEGGLTLTGGFSDFGFNYVGALKGAGKIKCELTGTNGRNYVRFEGDASEFTGTIEFSTGSTYRIALATTETADSAFTSSAAKSVYVADGVTTSLTGSTNGTVIGAGTLVADGAMPSAALQNNLKASTWTGTLWLKNLPASAERSATLIGNSSSVVRYTNVRGWVTTAMKFDGTVDIVNDENGNGLTIDNGSSNWATDRVVRFGCLTGNGTLNLAWNKTYPLHLPDVSGFTGSINCAQANGIGVIIGAEATIAKGGNGKIAVLEGAEATITDGTTWAAPNGVVIDGALTVNGTLQSEVSGSGRLGYTKFNKVHANVKTGLKKAAWTGTLVITGDGAINDGTVDGAAYTSLNEYGSIASKIELAGNCSGYFGLSTKTGSEETPTVVQPELVVSGTWSQNSGYSQASNSKGYSTIFRKVSGTGTMSSPSGKPNQLYYIEDASAFTGTLEAIAGKFVIGSRVDNTLITNGTITIKEGETIPAGLTWKASAGITFAGTVDFASAPEAGDVALANGVDNGTVTLGATAAYTIGGVADTTLVLKADGSKIVLAASLPDWVNPESEAQIDAYNTWAEANGVTDPTTAKKAAFAFNCANDDEAIAAEEKAFVITSITIVDGVVTVTAKSTNKAGQPFNVTPVIKGSATVNGAYDLPEENEAARFFKAFIEL